MSEANIIPKKEKKFTNRLSLKEILKGIHQADVKSYQIQRKSKVTLHFKNLV